MNSKAIFFSKNRDKLSKILKDNSLVVVFSADEYPRNGDQFFKFRQDSTMFYLSGLNQKGCSLILYPSNSEIDNREFISVPFSTEISKLWNGYSYSLEDAAKISGVKNIIYNDAFEKQLDTLIEKCDNIYILRNEYPKFKSEVLNRNERMGEELKKRYPEKNFEMLAPNITQLRMVKEPEEIEIMQKAVDITKDAFFNVLKTLKVGLVEYEIEAEIIYSFTKKGANGHAYLPICASGKNACVLHYVENSSKCNDGDLLLLDFGAEYNNYSADCSRTIPVNGKFSPRQRECYEAVLRVMKKAVKLYVPRNSISKINNYVWNEMEKEMVELGLFSWEDVAKQDAENPLYKKYLPHGVAHHLGLDVHDIVDMEASFKTGMVLTLEPGIYIPEENIGIRIENNIMVAETPVDLTSAIPREIDEIENIMMVGRD